MLRAEFTGKHNVAGALPISTSLLIKNTHKGNLENVINITF